MSTKPSRRALTVAFLTLLIGAPGCEDTLEPRATPTPVEGLLPDKSAPDVDLPDVHDATPEDTTPEDTTPEDTAANELPEDTTPTEDTRVGLDLGVSDTAPTDTPIDTSNLGACLDACALADERIDACFGGNTLERDPAALLLARDALAFYTGDARDDDLERLAHELDARLSRSADGRVVVFDGALRWRIRERSAELPGLGRELPTLATATTGRRTVATHQLTLRFHPTTRAEAILADAGVHIVRPLAFGHLGFIAAIDPARDVADVFDVSAELSAHPEVRYAAPDLLRSYSHRADPLFARQWHLEANDDNGAWTGADIEAMDAWTLSRGSHATTIAINDDGVDLGHPDLAPNILEAFDPPRDLERLFRRGWAAHGTAVAGVVAAVGDNDIGGRGVCPGCGLLPLFTDLDLSADSTIAESFTWPADRGAAAVNNSWGPADGDPTILGGDETREPEPLAPVVEEAIQYAEREGRDGLGTVLVFAAGNGNETTRSDPFVSHPLTVGVAATDDLGRKAWYSDFGDGVDIAAPSSGGLTPGIFTTDIRANYGYNPGERSLGDSSGDHTNDFGGTSSATPVVSGVIGLMVDANPDLTAAQIRDLLRQSADPIDPLRADYEDGHSRYYGAGRVNAYRAVRAALGDACLPLDAERCNGIDDTCDGQIDEGCAPLPICAPCDALGACGPDALCAHTPGDDAPRCLSRADADGACPDGWVAEGPACAPTSGRCAPCLDAERCNGIDDTCDGRVDEDACAVVGLGDDCDFDAECPSTARCTGGVCTARCTSARSCGDDFLTCAPYTEPYGDPTDFTICGYFEPSCADLRCNDHSSNQRAWLIRCLEDAGSSCEAIAACVYGF